MGRIALAAKVTHVPSIYLSEQPGPAYGVRAGAIAGLQTLGQRARERGVETFVLFDVHWINSIGFHLNATPHLRGVYTSSELPHFIHDWPYDYQGDPELAQAIVGELETRGHTGYAHDYETLGLEYGTLIPMYHMNRDAACRVLAIGSNLYATLEEYRALGEAVRRAVERSERTVAVIASGSLSHKFWTNRLAPQGLATISDEFNRQMDLHVLDLWREGRHKEFLELLPTYAKACNGEINMADTIALFGALGWGQYAGRAEILGEYFAASGTGQVNAEFPV